MAIDNWLSQKVLICVGSGGVGKTTVSASLGVLAAKSGKKVLVMTIDPSQRLRVALGLEYEDNSNESGVVKVPNQNYSGELYATWLNAEKIFDQFIASSSENQELGQKLLKNRLYKQLSTTLSGSQEFTSLLQLTKIVDQSEYDLVILDTPPAQHAIDFLEAPEKLHALFQDSVVRWFLGEEESVGFIRKIIAKGTMTVLLALQKITGSDFMAELSDFFKSVRTVQAKITTRTTMVRELLRRKDTKFLLVTAFDQAKLLEARQLQDYLKAQDYQLNGVLVNRVFPKWYQASMAGDALLSPDPVIGDSLKAWQNYFYDRNIFYKKFVKEWQTDAYVLTLPDLSQELAGLEALEVMTNEIRTSDMQSSEQV